MKRMMRSAAVLAVGCGLAFGLARASAAKPADAHAAPVQVPAAKPLPALPEKLPRWMVFDQVGVQGLRMVGGD